MDLQSEKYALGILLWRIAKKALVGYSCLQNKPVPLLENPMLRPESDVTVIIPTIDISDELIPRLRTMLANCPRELIIVTTSPLFDLLNSLLHKHLPKSSHCEVEVRTLHTPLPNKRKQMAHAIQNAKGQIIVLADDDVFWPPTMLKHVLTVFDQSPDIGGVGTLQQAHGLDSRRPETITVWEALAARRISRNNIQEAASIQIDGSTTCLSGRTVAYRSVILQDEAFLTSFTNEYWLGRYHLNSGDDAFLTRWLLNTGWNTHIQTALDALITTTVAPSSIYLKQNARWGRNAYRSRTKRLLFSRRVWR
ncbi:hypothetical protein BBP40_005735 [Aspergillus hancockii]|nr:hypothetical protein BBP40_005735 [Aspergillus hancockii]